jgi:uncharacterized protein YqeY
MAMLKKIEAELKEALRKKDAVKVSTLRFLLAAIREKEIELKKRGQLTDEEIIGVIRQQVKQHQESIAAYKQGSREDLVKKEREELDILNKYLPQQLSPDELAKIVKAVIEQTGAGSEKDFGQVMSQVMKQVKGRSEGKIVAEMVKKQLQSSS